MNIGLVLISKIHLILQFKHKSSRDIALTLNDKPYSI